MNYDIQYQPAYAMARVKLNPGDQVRAEAGSMIAMSATISADAKAHGGIGKALGRLLGGESVFQTTFTATQGPGEVLLAPSTPGDIVGLEVSTVPLMITSGSFLACDPHLDLSVQASSRSLFSGEGLFLLKASGQGTVLVSSFGAIHAVQLAVGQPYLVDTGNLVAFHDGMQFEIRRATKGIIGMVTSGEGFVAQITGPGLVMIQTRTPSSFGSWLRPFVGSNG